jgi:hypothetical protein
MTLSQIRNSHQGHRSRQLRLQDLNKMLNTFPSIIDSVQERSTHSHSRGAQTHALEDVGAAAHAAVDEDFEL